MTVFWLYAGLLCAAALAFVLVPQLRPPRRRIEAGRTSLNVALYRERLHELTMQRDAGTLDPDHFEAARAEAARGLLADAHGEEPVAARPLGRTVPLAAALATPLAAVVLYLHWGSLDQLMLARQHGGRPQPSMEKIAARLENLLAESPDSAEGWTLLGRAYMARGRAADAAAAFERAASLAGRPAELLGRWAEALYFAGDRQWTSRIQALTEEALASNPLETASLRLAGMGAFQAGRYAEAAAYWDRLAATLPETDPGRAVIADDIARARQLARPESAKEGPP